MTSFDRGDFTDVDRAADPAQLVRFLADVGGLAFVQAYKQRSFELLEIRSGVVLLDVGSGNGDDARAMALLVGSNGRVVGVDRSETLIADAVARHGSEELPVEYRVADATALPFGDATFAGVRADRVFHHLEDPALAMREIVRVTAPGGRVVTYDPDIETAIVDSADRALTRTVLNANCDSFRNGWMARHMPALFKDAGLVGVRVEPMTMLLVDYAQADQILALEGTVARAQSARLIDPAAGQRWLSDLRAASAAERFFAAVTGFMVSGRVGEI